MFLFAVMFSLVNAVTVSYCIEHWAFLNFFMTCHNRLNVTLAISWSHPWQFCFLEGHTAVLFYATDCMCLCIFKAVDKERAQAGGNNFKADFVNSYVCFVTTLVCFQPQVHIIRLTSQFIKLWSFFCFSAINDLYILQQVTRYWLSVNCTLSVSCCVESRCHNTHLSVGIMGRSTGSVQKACKHTSPLRPQTGVTLPSCSLSLGGVWGWIYGRATTEFRTYGLVLFSSSSFLRQHGVRDAFGFFFFFFLNLVGSFETLHFISFSQW